ncbi:hypothetical protein [Planotetraspora sp. GP83]|uniref:hypothetical protein n=1 Tax=Planotetraspora sp. GP83 TaxID=3156264 RepID=UPI0035115ED5
MTNPSPQGQDDDRYRGLGPIFYVFVGSPILVYAGIDNLTTGDDWLDFTAAAFALVPAVYLLWQAPKIVLAHVRRTRRPDRSPGQPPYEP